MDQQTQDAQLQDKIQILANAMSLLADAQAASAFAIQLAKKSLEGQEPNVLMSSAPKVKIAELGLAALKQGTESIAVVIQLSSYVLSMKEEIQSDYARRAEPKDNG